LNYFSKSISKSNNINDFRINDNNIEFNYDISKLSNAYLSGKFEKRKCYACHKYGHPAAFCTRTQKLRAKQQKILDNKIYWRKMRESKKMMKQIEKPWYRAGVTDEKKPEEIPQFDLSVVQRTLEILVRKIVHIESQLGEINKKFTSAIEKPVGDLNLVKAKSAKIEKELKNSLVEIFTIRNTVAESPKNEVKEEQKEKKGISIADPAVEALLNAEEKSTKQERTNEEFFNWLNKVPAKKSTQRAKDDKIPTAQTSTSVPSLKSHGLEEEEICTLEGNKSQFVKKESSQHQIPESDSETINNEEEEEEVALKEPKTDSVKYKKPEGPDRIKKMAIAIACNYEDVRVSDLLAKYTPSQIEQEWEAIYWGSSELR